MTNGQDRMSAEDGLLEVWERAFLAGTSWRPSLHAGMSAMARLLHEDPQAAERCPLIGLAPMGERATDLAIEREQSRDRVLEVLHQQWAKCHEAPAPSLYFEVFIGEMASLVHQRLTADGDYDDLAQAAVSMWGPDRVRNAGSQTAATARPAVN